MKNGDLVDPLAVGLLGKVLNGKRVVEVYLEGVQPVIRAARDRGSIYRLARRQHAWLLSTSTASATEGEEQQFGRPARAHARTQSKSGVAVDMPQGAAL